MRSGIGIDGNYFAYMCIFRYLLPPTDTVYALACADRKMTPKSLILSDGTRAHWIGNPSAKKLVLNFHGGGYTVPASKEMVEFMFQVVDVLNSQDRKEEAACLFLSYGELVSVTSS